MTLTKRALLGAAVGFALCCAVIYAAAHLILTRSFDKLERALLVKDVERAVNSVEAESRSLSGVTQEWAVWDDMWAYAVNGNKEFEQANLEPSSAVRARIDVLIISDAAGRFVFAHGVDQDKSAYTPVPPGLAQALQDVPSLLRHAAPDSRVSGVLIMPEGPMLVSSCPVVKGNGAGPVHGAVLMGRYLTQRNTARLSETTRLDLAFSPVSSASGEWLAAASGITKNAAAFVGTPQASRIHGYAVISNLSGAPGLLVRVTKDRDVSARGAQALNYVGVSLAIIALLGLAGGRVLHSWLSGRIAGEIARLRMAIAASEALAIELSEVSASVASRSAGQAASTDRTVESVANMADATEGSALRIAESDSLVKGAASQIATAAKRMEGVHSAMGDAASSGARMLSIVKTIQQFASQTNLLALNASIEAARAGAAGMGFAVVADAIGRLAQSSSEASRNTAELIEQTIAAINGGAESASKVNSDLALASKSWTGASEALNLVSQAAREQLDQIGHIRGATGEVGQAARDNGNTAQKAADAALRVREETGQLNHILERLEKLI